MTPISDWQALESEDVSPSPLAGPIGYEMPNILFGCSTGPVSPHWSPTMTPGSWDCVQYAVGHHANDRSQHFPLSRRGFVANVSTPVSGALILDGVASIGDYRCQVQGDVFAASGWVILPDSYPSRAPHFDRMLREIRDWTGWSQRRLAALIGTTHPTVKRLEKGETSSRSADAAARLPHINNVIKRLWILSGGNAKSVARLLDSSGPGDARSAFDLLTQEQYSRAYLRALQVLEGPSALDLLTPNAGVSELDATHSPADTEML